MHILPILVPITSEPDLQMVTIRSRGLRNNQFLQYSQERRTVGTLIRKLYRYYPLPLHTHTRVKHQVPRRLRRLRWPHRSVVLQLCSKRESRSVVRIERVSISHVSKQYIVSPSGALHLNSYTGKRAIRLSAGFYRSDNNNNTNNCYLLYNYNIGYRVVFNGTASPCSAVNALVRLGWTARLPSSLVRTRESAK